MQKLLQKLRSLKVVAMFVAATAIGSLSVGQGALAVNNPSYFDVPKDSPQRVCYKQLDAGWRALGFRNLDHCLRYVSTPAPEEKADCNGGWWFVYGFNSISECKAWVVAHGGGGYDGDPNEAY